MPTSQLKIQLFGPPTIYLNGVEIQQALPIKASATLYYLAATRRTHHRSHLAGLLWAAMPEARARNNLSIVRNRWKQAGILPLMHLTKREIGFATPPETDLQRFEAIALRPSAYTLADIEGVIQHYRGLFLDGFILDDPENTELFTEWLYPQREHWRQQALKLFSYLVEQQLAQKRSKAALITARKIISIEPAQETAHRTAIRILMSSGQREAARNQYEQCVSILETQLGLLPSPETVALHKQITSATSFSIPETGLLAKKHAPFQAPLIPTHFVGRQQTIEALVATLSSRSTTATALVGMGGIGKSTLAAAVAHAVRDRFPDGVLWAHAYQQDLASILTDWAKLFDVDLQHLNSLQNRAAAFLELISTKQVLLVLDNVVAADDVRIVLPKSPNVQLLITTRNTDVAYALGAELFQVAVLANGIPLLEKLIGTKRIRAEIKAATELTELLAQLPLALEIVGRRLQSRARLKIQLFVNQLKQQQSRLEPLTLSNWAVRSSFQISWDALNDELKHVFCALSVFQGQPFQAAAVAATTNTDLDSAELKLDDLAAMSLVSEKDGLHYQQHALLAEFAKEQAKAFEIWDSLRNRFIAFYTLAIEKEQVEVVREEWHSFHLAIRHAYDLHAYHMLVTLVQKLIPIYFAQGLYSQARESISIAVEAAESLVDSAAHAVLLYHWGEACVEQTDYAEAKNKLQMCLQLMEANLDRQIRSDVQLLLGRIAQEEGNTKLAEQLLFQCKAEKKLLADEFGIAKVDEHLARWAFQIGDFKSSQRFAENAIARFSGVNSVWKVWAMLRLVSLRIYQRDYQGASQLSIQALKEANLTDNYPVKAEALYLALVCAVRMKASGAATQYANRCRTLFQQMGAKKYQGFIHHEMSVLSANLGNHLEAIQYAAQAEAIFRSLDATYELVTVLVQQARSKQKTRDFASARACLTEAKLLGIATQHTQLEEIEQLLTA